MTRRVCKFRQREISRVIRGAQAAGVAVDRVEVDNEGKIVVYSGTGGDNPTKHKNTADAVLEKLKNERKT
jgi:hypothetical protein